MKKEKKVVSEADMKAAAEMRQEIDQPIITKQKSQDDAMI